MHVIPSCEIPSFCATDASSHTGNARLEPHIGNAGESVSDILTEKSSHVTLVRTSPRIRNGYVVFFKKLFSDRPPASDSRGALRVLGNLNVRHPGILPIGPFKPCFGHQLDRLS